MRFPRLACSLLALALFGCSSTETGADGLGGTTDDASVGGDDATNGGDGGGTPVETGNGIGIDGSVPNPTNDAPIGDACIGVQSEGKQIPLDLYVMFDQSGSMLERTGGGGSPTKWDAVKAAMKTFLADPASNGIGVGIQFFPLNPMNVPINCTSEAACNGYGPCTTTKACEAESIAAKQVINCWQDSDCASGTGCKDVGSCSNNPAAGCFSNANCLAPGKCNVPTTCQMRQCKIDDYATPEVTIAPLPGVQTSIVAALDKHMPLGNTPTSAALSGALKQASQFAAANPTHVVVVLLVTDGEPTDCMPLDVTKIAALATTGANATPSVKTYVIGVVGKGEANLAMNLHTISKAGNGKDAFIVSTASDVTKDFTAALNAIRGTALACEYELPANLGADYFKVNVKVTTAAGVSSVLPYVGDASKCGANGGWYYDVDPMAGTPKRILMCPATCTTFKSTTGNKIDIEVGCKTVVIVK